jgi:Domain of unknown function (DUF4432)
MPVDVLPPRHLLGSPRQHATVRRIVLDDGAERGVRALAFSTGGGLDFWVLCDRAFDIGPLWWRGTQLAWQSPAGFPAPDLTERWDDSGRGMERGFSGMLLTCGLEHIRTPAGGAPLHGHLPYTPGHLLACGEAWNAGEPLLSCEGEMIQYRLGGEGLRLVRRIEAPIGGNELRMHDTLENIGPEPQPIAVLYHVNPGYPLVADGTVATLDGRRIVGPLHPPETTNGPAEWHDAAGTEATATVSAPDYPVTLEVTWPTDTLPGLQTWRNLRRNVCVLSIEPCTAAPGAANPVLQPGETRRLSLTLRLVPS